jgi:hypothetical protein
MDSGTSFSQVRHAQLNSKSELPFTDVLSSEKIVSCLVDEGIEYRDRIFTPDVTLWTFLSQVLGANKSLQAAVTKVIAFKVAQGEAAPSANTSAYSKARDRLPEHLISRLARESGLDLHEQAPKDWRWRERPRKLLDGSTVSMPDTIENQAEFPQPKSQKPGIGFPIARMVAIISCETGSVLDLELGPYRGKGSGEHGLLRELMHNFFPGDIVLGDCYYCTFFLIASLIDSGIDAVFPLHGARDCDFRTGEHLGKKDHIATWIKPQKPTWMDQETYNSFPESIKVREAEVTLDHKGHRSEKRVLVTTFIDPKVVSKSDLRELYGHRWLVEIDLKAIKSTMNMDVLRAKTPEMVRKEIWASLLAYNLIRKIMAQAAFIHGKNPRKLSFSLALQTIESFRSAHIFCEDKKEIYAEILKAIANKTVGNRPGRREPRAIKRRPKPFPRLQQPRWKFHENAAS